MKQECQFVEYFNLSRTNESRKVEQETNYYLFSSKQTRATLARYNYEAKYDFFERRITTL